MVEINRIASLNIFLSHYLERNSYLDKSRKSHAIIGLTFPPSLTWPGQLLIDWGDNLLFRSICLFWFSSPFFFVRPQLICPFFFAFSLSLSSINRFAFFVRFILFFVCLSSINLSFLRFISFFIYPLSVDLSFLLSSPFCLCVLNRFVLSTSREQLSN